MALQKVGVVLTAEQATQFFKTIQESNKSVEEFSKSLQGVTINLTAMNKAAKASARIQELTSKLELQQRQLGILNQEYTRLVQKYGESSEKAQKKKLAMDKLQASINQTSTQIKVLESSLVEVGKVEDDTTKKTGLLERMLGKSLPVAIGNLISDGIKRLASSLVDLGIKGVGLAASFQDSMNMFRVQSQASNEEMQRFSETAKALGADLTLPGTSAVDAGEAMLELSKAGLSVNDTMNAAKGVLQLSAAGNLSNAEAAEIAANALQSFRLEGSKATKVANLLAAAANASSLNVEDVAAGFKMASAVFNAFQSPVVGAENAMIDLTTSLAVLANAGIKGSDAGTSLKQTLLQLTGPSDNAQKMMTELARKIGINGDIAFDAAGNMRPLKEIIENTAKATANLSDKEKDRYITEIFGADASRAILVLMDSMSDKAVTLGQDYDSMREAVQRNNAAGDLAAARMAGLNGAIQGLISQGETLLQEFFEPWLPLMESAVKGATSLLTTMIGFAPAIQSFADGVTVVVENFDRLVPLLGAAAATLLFYQGIVKGTLFKVLAWTEATIANTIAQKANTGAILSNVGAMAKAALGMAALGVAVGVAILQYQRYKQSISESTDKLLESSPKYQAASKALTKYGTSSEFVQEQLKGQKQRLEELQRVQKEELERLGDLGSRAKLTSSQNFQRQYDELHAQTNQRFADIEAETRSLEANMAAYDVAAQITATLEQEKQRLAAAQALVASGEADFASALQYSEDQIRDATKAIEDLRAAGPGALADLGNSQLDFQSNIEKLQKDHNQRMKDLNEELAKETDETQKGAIRERIENEKQAFKDEFQTTSVAYANERAAQRAHLGAMLIDYVNAMAIKDERFRAKSAELNTAIAQEYGVQADASQLLFGSLLNDIDGYTNGTITSLDDMIYQMQETEAQMTEVQATTRKLTDEEVANLIKKFQDGKISIEELSLALGKIPPKITTDIVVQYTERNRPEPLPNTRQVLPIDAQTPGRGANGARTEVARAGGGPIRKFQPTLIGEEGPEVLIPKVSGYVMNNSILRSTMSKVPEIYRNISKIMQLKHRSSSANTPSNAMSIGLSTPPMEVSKPAQISQAARFAKGGNTLVFSPSVSVDATNTGADPQQIAQLSVGIMFQNLNGLLDKAILKG